MKTIIQDTHEDIYLDNEKIRVKLSNHSSIALSVDTGIGMTLYNLRIVSEELRDRDIYITIRPDAAIKKILTSFSSSVKEVVS